jgi:hypothetical protein
LWRVSNSELYTIDALGVATYITPITGTRGGWRGGATFHEGQLWISVDGSGRSTDLMTVDLVTGEATSTGIRIPDASVDSLASMTP